MLWAAGGTGSFRLRPLLLPFCLAVILLSAFSSLLIQGGRDTSSDGQPLAWSEHVSGRLSRLSDYASSSFSGWAKLDSKGQAEVRRCEAILERQERQFGRRVLQKSVAHAGTGMRLRRAMRKLVRGEPVVVSALGGSITAGSYMPVISNETQWIGRVFALITEAFPHPDHVFTIGAIGGLGSEYFQHCGAEHMAENPDIVFIEHAINDQIGTVAQVAFENEVRFLLEGPSRPAVIGVEAMALLPGKAMTTASAQQLDVCRYYDLPYISLRDALLPELVAHPQRIPLFFGRDGLGVNLNHPSTRGHWALGNFVANHLFASVVDMARVGTLGQAADAGPRDVMDANDLDVDEHVLESDEVELAAWHAHDLEDGVAETQWGSELVYNDVPRIGLTDHFDFHTVRESPTPRCFALNGTREKLAYETVAMGQQADGTPGTGWIEWFSTQSSRAKYYVATTSLHAIVRFELVVRDEGIVGLTYLRSQSFGLGKAECWLDDARDKAVMLNGYWDNWHNLGDTVFPFEGIRGGAHTLSCETIDGHDFRIIAVITK